MSDTLLDCLVIGGGPAGLVASVYLARYRRTLRLVDAGASRLQWIPKTRNVLGFPDGIAGTTLWERLKQQAARYGVEPTAGRIDALRRVEGGIFEARADGLALRARTVLLCTGARDVPPRVAGLDVGAALRCGQVRYCPICDGFETQHQRVAVLGREGHGLREAVFVAGFDNEVTWLSMGTGGALSLQDAARLRAARVRVEDEPPREIRCEPGRGVHVMLADGRVLAFDTLYPALGLAPASQLAVTLGARVSAQGTGQLQVDEHLRTTIAGLYAAGDVAQSLNQINVAAGQAAIAATAIHNALGDAVHGAL